MAENNLNTRIQLLYDTYTNWSTKNPKLKKGEMVQVEVPAAVGDVTQVPSILIKTGDGEHNFNNLPWTSGLAADVYDWAKAKEAPRSAWYVNITGTPNEPTGDKTPAEIYQAYTNGYAVYAVVQMADLFNETPFILPLVSIIPVSDSYKVAFSASAEPHKSGDEVVSITVTWNQKWYLFASELAKAQDALPAMSSDTKGKMLTNDGGKAEWGDVPKEVMRVNFTKDTDNHWSADKNWDDAAALIEAGGYVYAMVDGLTIPFVNYAAGQVAGQVIIFHIGLHNTSTVKYNVVIWHQNGLISASEDVIPIVMYGEQTLTTDQQAQARKNIGAVSSSDIKFVYAIGQENILSLNDGNIYYIIEENVPLYLVSTANEYGGTTYTFCGFIYSANNQARILSKSYNTKGGWYTTVNTYDIPVGSTASLISDDDVDSVKIPYVEAVVNYVGNTTLKKTNTTEFTPTSDYQPATKKYVDDATASVPTKVSELTNDSNYITSSYVDTKVASLVDSAPETLDTLKELSAALGDDPNFATTISNQIGNKADKAQVLNITLAPASWTTSGNEFKYTYSNTSLRALASPIITCTSNTSEYKYITDAEATANTGITFTAKTKPTNNIVLQIIDLG